MNRQEAYALMLEFVESESLRRHMLNVEAAMRFYARYFGEDEERYAVTGLLHDFDYEKYPETHPAWGVEYLRGLGVDETILEAIMGHASYTVTPRNSNLARSLFAVDELTGLIQTAALIRPDKDVKQVELASLKKRFKNKAFAAGVNREEVTQGTQELGLDLDTHMQNVLQAMQQMEGA